MSEETIDIWPWGERWYLPHSLATGQLASAQYSISSDSGEVEYDQVFEISGMENLTDSRIHARVLRWWWMKVRCPIMRKFAWNEGMNNVPHTLG